MAKIVCKSAPMPSSGMSGMKNAVNRSGMKKGYAGLKNAGSRGKKMKKGY